MWLLSRDAFPIALSATYRGTMLLYTIEAPRRCLFARACVNRSRRICLG